MAKYLDENGLAYLWQSIKSKLSGKVDVVSGKSLSTNDYSAAEKAAVASNIAARHTHANSAVLGAIDAAKTASWDGKLDKSGGTLTGSLMLAGAPSVDMQAVNKKYVDDTLAGKGNGDMLKSVYDTNGNGTVDNAEKVGGLTVLTAVPAGAKFTDTTYAVATASAAGLFGNTDFAKLAAFGPAANYALKSEIASMYKYKGSKATLSALPTTGNLAGDVYNTEDTGMNHAWTGTAWDALGSSFTIASLANAEIDTILAS